MVEKLAGEATCPPPALRMPWATPDSVFLQAGGLESELGRAKASRAGAETKLTTTEDEIKRLNNILHDLHVEKSTTLATTQT
jgi:hypothetical protein